MFEIESPAFGNQDRIPTKYTADGVDVSPEVDFKNVPAGTKELALICDDPDAPSAEPWVHWVIYHIPADRKSLAEGFHPGGKDGIVVGKNSWSSGKTEGYRGPSPPPGTPHHYHFTLYALRDKVDLGAGATKNQLLKAIRPLVLEKAELVGVYGR